MGDTKRILVVDDHFEMLEFIRSMLETSSPDFQVTGVPSAEEGFLEMRRAPIDLLITDLRLPGMSGFELIRKVKTTFPETPVIMITGYSSDQGKEEAQELGVFRYFPKPLDTDGLLAAVQTALYGAPVTAVRADPVTNEAILPLEISRRLEILYTDTGARFITLASRSGEILFQAGNAAGLEMATIAPVIASNLRGSFELSALLGSDRPFTIQYQAGQQIDLYCANVGQTYLLALFFDAQSRRGRIGTVWVFAQRAIKDLLDSLAASAPSVELPTPVMTPGESVEQSELKPDVAPMVAETAVQPEPVAAEKPPRVSSEPLQEVDTLEDLWALDDEDIQALLKLEVTPPPDDVDLDSFWAAALESDTGREQADGLSFEEALRQGLVSFDEESEEDK